MRWVPQKSNGLENWSRTPRYPELVKYYYAIMIDLSDKAFITLIWPWFQVISSPWCAHNGDYINSRHRSCCKGLFRQAYWRNYAFTFASIRRSHWLHYRISSGTRPSHSTIWVARDLHIFWFEQFLKFRTNTKTRSHFAPAWRGYPFNLRSL